MALPDEARARATLVAMQARIAKGPHDALGVPPNATSAEVRAAFLDSTKLYHPARFMRMAVEIQRLSNEVFLGLRSSHDVLAKSLPPPPRQNRTSQMPPLHATGTGPLRVDNLPAASGRAATQGHASPSQPPPASPAGPRNPSQPIPVVRPALSASNASTSPGIPRADGSGGRTPAPVTVQPWKPNASSQPGSGVPTAGAAGTARALTPASGVRMPTPIAGRAPSPPVGANNRPTTPAGTPPPPRAPGEFDERAELMAAMDLVRRAQWPAARVALQNLATRAPGSKQYRATLCYVRAREAQDAGRIDDAIAELQRALQIDPNLSLAKTTLADLQTRRK